ncbi:hypothetical protein Tsubulata_040196 [Turnera subulata]|uniref:Uncharacterized protein n=1 Tax=Turnera subulata TaxID=218843 RepID=A0A9Q0J5T5_9ROSI|nr:hypothetical protein Tsubulata_040196 [Turnera subulata]
MQKRDQNKSGGSAGGASAPSAKRGRPFGSTAGALQQPPPPPPTRPPRPRSSALPYKSTPPSPIKITRESSWRYKAGSKAS